MHEILYTSVINILIYLCMKLLLLYYISLDQQSDFRMDPLNVLEFMDG